MKKTILAILLLHACLAARAAIPTLSGLADLLETLRTGFEARIAATSNRLEEARAAVEELRDGLAAVARSRDALLVVVEGDKSLRERFHGGRIGEYVVTNEAGRIIRVDLYADATVWTNGATVAAMADPEAAAKAAARAAEERERVQAAWEAANLPPDLAALRARQRETARAAAAQEEP